MIFVLRYSSALVMGLLLFGGFCAATERALPPDERFTQTAQQPPEPNSDAVRAAHGAQGGLEEHAQDAGPPNSFEGFELDIERPYLEEIQVIANPISDGRPQDLLDGRALESRAGGTLGALLDATPGVANASFGPGVGQPVIRGLTGPRVSILSDGMGVHDASAVSPDHGVAVEPLLAREIEIFRGARAMRFAGAGIGGAVDVRDFRIPERPRDGEVDAALGIRFNSNTHELSRVFRFDGGLGPFALHADGIRRDGGNTRIPGNALLEPAVLEQFGNVEEFENTQGVLPNTQTRARAHTLGGALVSESAYVGLAYKSADSLYGIPPGGLPPHSDDPANVLPTPEELKISMQQARWDFAAALTPLSGPIERLKFSLANVDYTHDELARGLPTTTFDSVTTELRTELVLRPHPNWRAEFGHQWLTKRFGAFGVEAYIPESDIDQQGLYFISELDLQLIRFEFGLRWDHARINPLEESRRAPGGFIVPLPSKFDFGPTSRTLGVHLTPNDMLALHLLFGSVERAPAVQELISLGPHFATRTFDLGNFLLETEQSTQVEFGLDWRTAYFDLSAALYRNRIDNFIYQENQGYFYDIETRFFQFACVQVTDCIPVYGYKQQPAELAGFELELDFFGPYFGPYALDFGVRADAVRGRFTESGLTGPSDDIPRLPPLRIGGYVELSEEDLSLRLDYTHVAAQDRPGLNETRTPGYHRVDATASWSTQLQRVRGRIFIAGKNLSNTDIRQSTSFMRNFAPEPGRTLELGITLQYF